MPQRSTCCKMQINYGMWLWLCMNNRFKKLLPQNNPSSSLHLLRCMKSFFQCDLVLVCPLYTGQNSVCKWSYNRHMNLKPPFMRFLIFHTKHKEHPVQKPIWQLTNVLTVLSLAGKTNLVLYVILNIVDPFPCII